MLIITKSAKETKSLGKMLAQEIKGGRIACLEGELGAGKTTFTQGFLQGLKIKGPYTSPTFLIMKHYKKGISNKSQNSKHKIQNIFHIDAYRIREKDLLNLGWEEIVADSNNIILVEWAERIRKIIPANSIWIKFKWISKNEREIIFESK